MYSESTQPQELIDGVPGLPKTESVPPPTGPEQVALSPQAEAKYKASEELFRQVSAQAIAKAQAPVEQVSAASADQLITMPPEIQSEAAALEPSPQQEIIASDQIPRS